MKEQGLLQKNYGDDTKVIVMLLVRSVKIIAMDVRKAFLFVNFKTIASQNNPTITSFERLLT